jgi:hypothetical protein
MDLTEETPTGALVGTGQPCVVTGRVRSEVVLQPAG